MSPSNFPATNPEVIRTAIRTRSASLAAGMQNLIEDLQKGRITRVDESAFEVGRNLAVTPGSVVFENELVQLIQYTPQTAEVEKTPLQLRALLDQQIACPVHRQRRLLLGRLHGHEPHRRPRHRFASRFRIGSVGLPALYIRT
jgi:hypothetical protein